MDDKSNIANSFAVLQALLKQSYSEDPNELQKAAIELSRGTFILQSIQNFFAILFFQYIYRKAVEGTLFPAVSFGPIAHAICRLMPSKNRTLV